MSQIQVNIPFYKGVKSCFQKFQRNLIGSVSNESHREFTLVGGGAGSGERGGDKNFIGPHLNLTPEWIFLGSACGMWWEKTEL